MFGLLLTDWDSIYFELHLLELFQIFWMSLTKPHCHLLCTWISCFIVAILAVYFYFLFFRNEWLRYIVHCITHGNFAVTVVTHSYSLFLLKKLIEHLLVVSLWLIHPIESSLCWWVIWSLLFICHQYLSYLELILVFHALSKQSRVTLRRHVAWSLVVFFLWRWFSFLIHFDLLNWECLLESCIGKWILTHL